MRSEKELMILNSKTMKSFWHLIQTRSLSNIILELWGWERKIQFTAGEPNMQTSVAYLCFKNRL